MQSNHRNVMIDTADDNPNVIYLDRDAPTVLVQTDPDTYELRKGRCVLGTVIFCDEQTRWGWKFMSRGNLSHSRKLHCNPETALRGCRIVVDYIVTMNSPQDIPENAS